MSGEQSLQSNDLIYTCLMPVVIVQILPVCQSLGGMLYHLPSHFTHMGWDTERLKKQIKVTPWVLIKPKNLASLIPEFRAELQPLRMVVEMWGGAGGD